MYNNEIAVIIFSRYPEKGKVKTRLAASLGKDFALAFYKICATHTFNECAKLQKDRIKVYLFYSGSDDIKIIEEWTNSKFILLEQNGEDLGERMNNAFYSVFKKGAGKAIIIGTDLPDISAGLLKKAADVLETFDAVIGPSYDGGYYLLGLKKAYEEIFQDIEWSTDKVYKETLDKIISRKLTLNILPELYDIDTEENLQQWFDSKNEKERHSIWEPLYSLYIKQKNRK